MAFVLGGRFLQRGTRSQSAIVLCTLLQDMSSLFFPDLGLQDCSDGL